jgi:hypothetical protein
MLLDTYTLSGQVFTKRDADLVRGSLYTDGATDIANRKSLLVKYQVDRKGTVRTLVDFSSNVADALTSTKVDHTRRVYLNIVRHPGDSNSDILADLEVIKAIITNTTLTGLIVNQTA